MSLTRENDRIHLIEDPPTAVVYKKKPKHHQRPDRTGKCATHGDAVPTPVSPKPAVTSPADNPVTTVVISAPNGVHVERGHTHSEAVDKRTGRYLALAVTLIMIFITLYHTFLRQVPLLAGLVPPAIIMILYLLYAVYFAKKREPQEVEVCPR